MKACFKCGRTLPLDAFYRHPATADGHLGKCKDCTKRDVRERSALTKLARAAYERKRGLRPERKRAAARYNRQGRARHPQHFRARGAVAHALKAGRLVRKPCEVCGNPKAEAHHPDHSRPLDVQWLCVPHHREAERKAA